MKIPTRDIANLHIAHAVKEIKKAAGCLSPNPKGLGAYNLGSVRPYVRTSMDSDFSEGCGSNSLKLYTKIYKSIQDNYRVTIDDG